MIIYFVGLGIGNLGLISLLSSIFAAIAPWGITIASFSAGLIAMLLSGLENNFSAVINQSLAIKQAAIVEPAINEVMIYATIIGCVVGAKITPLGSLSTLLWWQSLQHQRQLFQWSNYIAINLALTIPILFIALLFLAIWLPWLIVEN